jgi:hypothetical protein
MGNSELGREWEINATEGKEGNFRVGNANKTSRIQISNRCEERTETLSVLVFQSSSNTFRTTSSSQFSNKSS